MRDGAVLLMLLIVALTGSAVALCREPRRQVMVMGVNGLVLAALFMVLQAPDVALSEIAVGTTALPLLYLAVLVSIRTDRARQRRQAGPTDAPSDNRRS